MGWLDFLFHRSFWFDVFQRLIMASQDKTIQVIVCKCGSEFAACIVPECYTDKDWQKDLRECVKNGCTVKMVESGTFSFERCKCPAVPKNPNQLKLF